MTDGKNDLSFDVYNERYSTNIKILSLLCLVSTMGSTDVIIYPFFT